MTRRSALLSTALVVGALTKDLRAQEKLVFSAKVRLLEPSALKFDLRGYKSYIFSLDGETLTFTPEEIMAALRGEPR